MLVLGQTQDYPSPKNTRLRFIAHELSSLTRYASHPAGYPPAILPMTPNGRSFLPSKQSGWFTGKKHPTNQQGSWKKLKSISNRPDQSKFNSDKQSESLPLQPTTASDNHRQSVCLAHPNIYHKEDHKQNGLSEKSIDYEGIYIT